MNIPPRLFQNLIWSLISLDVFDQCEDNALFQNKAHNMEDLIYKVVTGMMNKIPFVTLLIKNSQVQIYLADSDLHNLAQKIDPFQKLTSKNV